MSISHTDLIRDALGLLGVLRETQAPTAEQGKLGLRVLHEMLASWEQDNIDLGYVASDTLGDTVSVDDGYIPVIKYSLAHMLAPYFGIQTPPVVLQLAIGYYNRLVRDFVNERVQPVSMSHIHGGSANWTRTTF